MRTFRVRALLSCLAVLFLATGCFQQAGSAQQSTAVSQALPSPTPIPSDTPEPLPTEEPTEIPTEIPEVEPTESSEGLSAQDLLDATPPASPTSFLEVAQAEEPENPLDLTATAIVLNATATQYAAQTATADFLFGTPIPTATEPPTFDPNVTPTPMPVAPGADCVHEVRAGENLFRISLTYGVLVNDIAQASGVVNPNVIRVGQMLTIPGCGTTGARPPATSTPGPGGGTTPGGSPGGGTTYTVQQGDTLFALSLRFGVPVNSIAAANGISNINLIYMGQSLTIPAS